MRIGAGVATAMLVFLLPQFAGGQAQADTTDAADPVATLQDFIAEEEAGAAPAPQLPGQTTLQSLAAIDSGTARAYVAALRELYLYQRTGFQHRAKVFRWQFYSSIVIFVIVHLLVLAGLYFSWMQFRKGSDGMASNLEISHTGVKVQSSVLGVIILVVSLAFFYLYLVYVYPINEII